MYRTNCTQERITDNRRDSYIIHVEKEGRIPIWRSDLLNFVSVAATGSYHGTLHYYFSKTRKRYFLSVGSTRGRLL